VDAPCVDLTAGYPALPGDVLRNLRKAARRLERDGVTEMIRFWTSAADLARFRPLITAAWIARNRAAGRPTEPEDWEPLYDQAAEVATLELDGQLAAWELAAVDPPAYVILAGQMVPGWERYRPGRLLEEAVIRRALDLGYDCIDWGSSDHAGALIAVSP
jgi:Acetyltransferase (GNAT) domain